MLLVLVRHGGVAALLAAVAAEALLWLFGIVSLSPWLILLGLLPFYLSEYGMRRFALRQTSGDRYFLHLMQDLPFVRIFCGSTTVTATVSRRGLFFALQSSRNSSNQNPPCCDSPCGFLPKNLPMLPRLRWMVLP